MKQNYIFFKNLLLIIVTIALYCSPFKTQAQCDHYDITLSASVTVATCLNNGSITVTISGLDIDNVKLDDAELRLLPLNGGQYVDWVQWDGDGTIKTTPTGIVPGDYRIEFRAFCRIGNDWSVTRSTIGNPPPITVPGNYTPLEFSVGMARKTMTCRPTGLIRLAFSHGAGPYTVNVTSYPAGYSGKTNWTTPATATTDTLNHVPAGTYTIEVEDMCGYTVTKAVVVDTLLQDIPLDQNGVNMVLANVRIARPLDVTDCQTIQVLQNAFIPSNWDWSDYWINSAQYYECAYLMNGAGTKVWQDHPGRGIVPAVELPAPATYTSFCSSSDQLWAYIRPKGCTAPSVEKSVQLDKASYLCSTNPFLNKVVTLDDEGSCITAKLGLDIDYYYGICYPAQWKVTATATPDIIIQQGTLTGQSVRTSTGWGEWLSNDTTSASYPRGVQYTITITGADNRGYTRSWMPPAGGQSFTVNNTLCTGSDECCGHDGRFIYSESPISLGTKIKYVSGPMPLPWGNVGDTYTITFPMPNERMFHLAYPNLFYDFKAGIYTFEITNICGIVSTRSFTRDYNYSYDDLTYTSELTCEGLKIYPEGSVRRTDANGVTTITDTYYYISRAPTGVIFNSGKVGPGEHLLLPLPGNYQITMTYNSGYNCGRTFTVVYPADGLTLDPETLSAYVCEGEPFGNIICEGINGVAPYSYYLHPTSYSPGMPSDNGVFYDVGRADSVLYITVTDACGASMPVAVTMLDLKNANIVYSSYPNPICQGSEIAINCVSLGRTHYTWSGPSGFPPPNQIFVQRPRFTAGANASGFYKVSVVPENCPLPKTDSVEIVVEPAPPAVIVHNPNIMLCFNSGNINIAEMSGATALPGYTLLWYADSISTTPITPPTSVSTATSNTYVYFVGQEEPVHNCRSVVRTRITATITDATPSNVYVDLDEICVGGTAILTVDPDIPGAYWVSSNSLVATVSGNMVTGISVGNATFTIFPPSSAAGCSVTTDPLEVVFKSATIRYARTTYYNNDFPAPVILNAPLDGIFSAMPAGLSIDATNGTITPRKSIPGSYTITYITPDLEPCETSVITEVKIIDAYIPNDANEFEIWNWDDLAHVEYVQTKHNVNKFKLMQNLGIPGVTASYGDGTGLELRNQEIKNRHKGDKRFGWWGFEGFTMPINSDDTTVYNESAVDYNALIVARSIAAAAEYDENAWIRDDSCGWEANAGWKPIGLRTAFLGTFDGGGNAITGLWINRTTATNQALFGSIAGISANPTTIKNLGINISNKNITGGEYSGGLIGIAQTTTIGTVTIINCYVTGNVSSMGGTGSYAGGLVASSAGVIISNCYTTGAITGSYVIGGLVGMSRNTRISNCYTTGNITATGVPTSGVGGLVGQSPSATNTNGTVITNCYTTGVIEGFTEVGGILGWSRANNSALANRDQISQCFALNSQLIFQPYSSDYGRVLGSDFGSNIILNNNFALDSMKMNDVPFNDYAAPDNNHGANISAYQAVKDTTRYTSNGWTFPGVWTRDYTNYGVTPTTNLPILSVFTLTGYPDAVQPPHIDCETCANIILDLKLFLQGVTQPDSIMTNYIQVPIMPEAMPNLKLPVTNPYDVQGNYFQINDESGPAGTIVDWILVEIWGNFEVSGIFTEYDLLESHALLLKPDGSVVDTNGQKPQLILNTDDSVRVVIKHRNHLSVVSNVLFPYNEDIIYDFSTGITQAVKAPLAMYDPMIMYYGLACLWAGDLNMNGFMDHVDMSIFNIEWMAGNFGKYVVSDVNMDGFVNSLDGSFVTRNTKLGLYSPVYFFRKK